MKRVVLLTMLVVSLAANSQVFIGVRDACYAQIGYEYKNRWNAVLEHSLYGEKIGFQKVRLMVGYNQFLESFDLKLMPYISTIWNGNYKDCGAFVAVKTELMKDWGIDGTVNPHYDSMLDYKTFFSVGTTVKIFKYVALIVHYSTIPEYRMSEKRIRTGLDISIGPLSVMPELSIPIEGNNVNVRSICSFRYIFKMN